MRADVLIAAALNRGTHAFDTSYRCADCRHHRLADRSAQRLAVCVRMRETIRTRFIDSKTRLIGGGPPRPSARKARGQMARIKLRPQAPDERRDGVVARARTAALRVTLPLRQRRLLRRLIAAADARRRRDKSFA
jgi:hypothetical protein